MTALAELSAALRVTVTVTGVRRLKLPRSRFGLEDPAWLGDGRPRSRVFKT